MLAKSLSCSLTIVVGQLTGSLRRLLDGLGLRVGGQEGPAVTLARRGLDRLESIHAFGEARYRGVERLAGSIATKPQCEKANQYEAEQDQGRFHERINAPGTVSVNRRVGRHDLGVHIACKQSIGIRMGGAAWVDPLPGRSSNGCRRLVIP